MSQEEDIGDIDTTVLRATLAWAPNDEWLVTGMINSQSMDVDGISTWEPNIGELSQVRYNKETKEDDWYVATLVIEGDLGFADFTSATGYMDRDITYNLDASTYLHQFQGVGGVYYNSLDIYTFGTVYASAYTYSRFPRYNGGIIGWTPGPGPVYLLHHGTPGRAGDDEQLMIRANALHRNSGLRPRPMRTSASSG